MTKRQTKLVENFIRREVRKSLREESDVTVESLESIESFLIDIQKNVQYLQNLVRMGAANKQRVMMKLASMKHNIGSIEAELNK